MKLFYIDDDIRYEVIISADGKTQNQIITPVDDVQALVDSGDAVVYDTVHELLETIEYASNRRNEYPDIEEQLDSLYHEIIVSGSLTSSGSWAQSIRAVKDANPKPTGSA